MKDVNLRYILVTNISLSRKIGIRKGNRNIILFLYKNLSCLFALNPLMAGNPYIPEQKCSSKLLACLSMYYLLLPPGYEWATC